MKFHSVTAGTFSSFLFFATLVHGADDLPHPILSISSNNGSAANTVLSTWTEAQYTNAFTPRYAPRNESYGFGAAVVSGDTGWSWSQNNPTQIVSTPSGTIFPNPDTVTYPIQTQAVTTFTGHTVQAPYYFRAGSTSSKSFVFNVIAYHQLGKRDSDLGNLAGAYVNTGLSQSSRDAYARRIAIALLDWGRWYPDYTLTGKNSATFINTSLTYVLSTDLQRASDHNGLAHEWNDTPLKAFDAIYDSAALTNLSLELGFDVRDFITTNVFFFEGDFFVNHVPVSVAIGSNLSGPYDVLPEVARVLNRPDYIEWMDQYLNATVTQKIRRDGVLEEGMGYSIGYLNANVTAALNTRNYFLTRPATNSEFAGISNRAVIYARTLQYGQAQWAKIALPNGQLPSFGDTPFNTYFSARNAGSSWVLPAYGTVAMGAGSGAQAVQVNQNFSGDNNHMRSDTTAFTLWAFNNEYLGNIRYYNGAIGRPFGEQILEKNAVTIDRVNETPFPDADTYGNGNLTLYEPGNHGLALTEIDGYRGYSSKASRFQRLMILNTEDLARPYVVDVFRVTGGTNHDYTFHGSVRWTQTGQCSFPLVTNDNLYPMLEPGDPAWSLATDTPYYGFFRGVNSNTAPGNFYITFADTNRATARDTRLWMTTDPGVYNVYLGWSPVPARDDTVPTNFFNSLNLTRPSAIIRHRVTTGPLQDLFVSVIEPMNGGVSNIVSVQRLPMSGSSLESCGLKVTFKDGRADTYLVNLRNPKAAGANTGSATISTLDGQYSLTGRVGLYSTNSAGATAWVVNGSYFQFPGGAYSPTNLYYSGGIAGATRQADGAAYDAFTTVTPLPTGTALRGKYLSLTHGALAGSGTTNLSELYQIDQVIQSNGLYYICFTNDPFLEITGATSVEQVAPLRTFTGSNTFEIALSAWTPVSSNPAPTNDLVAWLTFDDGTAGDASGYGNNGVLVGGASVVTDAQRGRVLLLDGVSGYVDLGNAASLNLSLSGQATIAAWVKVALTHNHNTILSKGEWKDAYSLLVKGDTSPPNLLWTGNDTSVFSGDAVPLNEWTHVAVTINGSLTSFYLNGQLSGATNQNRGNPIDQTTNDVCLGREQYSGSLPAGRWFFNGELDDVRIYNRALTAGEIQGVMRSGVGGMPQMSGATLRDGNFVFSGSNGVANAVYYVLATTNAAWPLSRWPVIATNTFDANGNFRFTNAPDPNWPQAFYLLKLQ